MKRKFSIKKGFTLVEILAVLAISAVIGTAIMSLFISAIKSYNVTNNENIIQDEGRMIVDFLENDIKVGKRISSISTGANTGKIKIGLDPHEYICSFALNKTVNPIYSYSVKESGVNTTYVYLWIENKLIKGKAKITALPDGTSLKEVEYLGVLSNNVKNISVDTASYPYKVNIILEALGSQNEYNISVTPRNK